MHVTVLEAENLRLLNALGNRLGRGEAEVITIALETEANIVALDDHVARERGHATRITGKRHSGDHQEINGVGQI